MENSLLDNSGTFTHVLPCVSYSFALPCLSKPNSNAGIDHALGLNKDVTRLGSESELEPVETRNSPSNKPHTKPQLCID